MLLKVHDQISNIERQVTQKAYDIINKGKKQRYKFLSYVDDNGNPIESQAAAPEILSEKKTEPQSPEKSAEPVVDNGQAEGITIVRKKPGPKPKVHAKE